MTVETFRNVTYRVRTSFTGCTRFRKEFIVLMNIYEDGFSFAVFTLNSRKWCRYVIFECPSPTVPNISRGLAYTSVQHPAYFGPLYGTWAYLRHVRLKWRNRADSNARSPGIIKFYFCFSFPYFCSHLWEGRQFHRVDEEVVWCLL